MVRLIESISDLEEELKNEKNKGKLIVLDFFAEWCGPCVRIAPLIETWSKNDDYKDSVIFLKCDVDQAEDVAQKYEIDAMPTFVFFKDEKEVDRLTGANQEKLQKAIDENKK